MWCCRSILVIVIITFVTNEIIAQNGSRCTTPNGENSICRSIYQCTKLLQVVNTTDSNQLKFLRDSQCGYDTNPLVCCGSLNNYRTISTTSRPSGRRATLGPRLVQLKNSNIPDRSSCGFQETDRIFNGVNTDMDEFPWMGLLQYRNSSGFKRFSCGGTLISPRYVLTAAHCITDAKAKNVGNLAIVRLGEWNTDTGKDCVKAGNIEVCNQEPLDAEVESTLVHEGYDMNNPNRRNDIALVRLRRPVTYTNYIRAICLPKPDESSNVGDILYVAGWGQTEERQSSPIKQKLGVPLASKSTCSSTFSTAGVTLGDSQICAGGEAGKDSCKVNYGCVLNDGRYDFDWFHGEECPQKVCDITEPDEESGENDNVIGDSGGPLMTTSKTDPTQWYIEGIVSFGARCGTEGWPGIYTKVSSYLNWIYQNVKS